MGRDESETCRSVSISKGKLVEESFYIDGEVIPSIVVKPVKRLSRWYNSMFSDRGQVEDLEELIVKALSTIERTMTKAARKWLGLQHCLSTVALYGKGFLGVISDQLLLEPLMMSSQLRRTSVSG